MAPKITPAALLIGGMCALGATLLPGVHARSARAEASAALRVMPIGDSITQGHQNWGPTYRYELWRMFQESGHDLDYVGSMTQTISGGYVFPDFDQQHEGHDGWRADQVNQQLAAWMHASQPHVLLVHLGHNDLIQGQSVTSTVDDLSELIDIARSVNPSVTVAIAQPIPCAESSGFCRSAELAELARRLPALGAAKTSAASRVIIVDMRAGFSISADLYDGLHPDASGERKIAERWLSALVPTDAPSPTPTLTALPTATQSPTPIPSLTATPIDPTATPSATAPVAIASTAPPDRATVEAPTATIMPVAAPRRQFWLPMVVGNGGENQ